MSCQATVKGNWHKTHTKIVGNCLDQPVLKTGPKTLLTEFAIHHGLERYEIGWQAVISLWAVQYLYFVKSSIILQERVFMHFRGLFFHWMLLLFPWFWHCFTFKIFIQHVNDITKILFLFMIVQVIYKVGQTAATLKNAWMSIVNIFTYTFIPPSSTRGIKLQFIGGHSF